MKFDELKYKISICIMLKKIYERLVRLYIKKRKQRYTEQV